MQTILVNFVSHVFVLCFRINQPTDHKNKVSLTFERFVVYVTMKYAQIFYTTATWLS